MDEVWLPAKKIDSFTDIPMMGNPAGLVEVPTDVSEGQMQRMAREMNLSETVFIAKDPVGDADVRLRYFTPTVEVPICGHATIAALHHLSEKAEEGRRFRLSTRVGILEGHVTKGIAWTTFDETKVLGVWPDDPTVLHELIGGADLLAPDARPVLFHDQNLALEVRDVETLDAIRPDLDRLAKIQRQRLDGLILFTTTGTRSGMTWHQRYFAPGYGIPEDPVTGLASARTANLLARLGRFSPPADGTVRARVRQGDALGRPGEVYVEMDLEGDEVRETRIGGGAVTVLEGRMRLPEA
jgi:trans-2,3-dihydro-3-hydroxyanthranilate isomerase